MGGRIDFEMSKKMATKGAEKYRDDPMVGVFEHPLVQHKLTSLRDKNTDTKLFRELVEELSMLMAYELTRDLPFTTRSVNTPIGVFKDGVSVQGSSIGIIPILRAGLGMVEGILKVVPMAPIGHIGLYRDPETLEPVEYYCKLPGGLPDRTLIVVDPMLATGGSASAAIGFLKDKGAKTIKLNCILAAPEGIERIKKEHPDVPIFVAGIDEKLNDHGYIVPGLGDAGDRLFGTK